MSIIHKHLVLGALLCLGIACFEGCYTRPPLEELGELEFAVPELPGINDPYPIPEEANSGATQEGSQQSPGNP